MSAGLGEDQGCQRDQDHIGGVRCVVRKQSNDKNGRGQEPGWQPPDSTPEQGREQPRSLGHCCAQHHRQHESQWWKPRQGFGHIDEQARDVFA